MEPVENEEIYLTATYDNRGRSFIDGWAHTEYGIRSELQTTTESLPDIPSDDRLSSNVLIGTSIQSMILGTSLLSIPYSIKLAGVWGLILIFVIGVLSTITADILSECQYQISRRQSAKKRIHSTFVDMCAACFHTRGKHVMEALVYLSLARNVIIIILLADLTEELIGGKMQYDKSVLPVLWTVAVLPLLFISKVSKLAWFTFIGMILYLLSVAAMFGIFMSTFRTWSFQSNFLHWDIKRVGVASGIIINSYAVHMNLPSLEGSMKKPSSYVYVTSLSFSMNVIIKMAFGLFGFLAFGENTSDEIANNLTQMHIDINVVRYCIRGSLILFTYFTIPLQSHVVFELIDSNFRYHFPIFSGKDQLWTLLSRLIVMTASLLVALLIPHFGIAVSIIGSVRGSLISLVLPPLFYINLKTHPLSKIKLFICYITVTLGILIGGIGFYSSVDALIEKVYS